MLEKTSGLAANAVLSAGIGLFVGIILIFLPVGLTEHKTNILMISTGIGILIGIVSRYSSCFVYEYGLKSPLWSYGLTFLSTLAGCSILSNPFNPSRAQLIICLVVAEPLALLAAYLNMRYIAKLNDNLRRKQAALKKQQAEQ